MSSGAQTSSSAFKVLPGGRRASGTFAGIRIVVARDEDPPFSTDAEVFEEDTWLTLSTESDIVDSPGHPVRIMTRVWEAEPERPGSVTVRPGPPVQLLAAVHDLDVDPSCTEEWVESALDEVFRASSEYRLHALKLPLLGSKHGNLPVTSFMTVLRRSLQRAVDRGAVEEEAGLQLQRLWLVRESEHGKELLAVLTTSD